MTLPTRKGCRGRDRTHDGDDLAQSTAGDHRRSAHLRCHVLVQPSGPGGVIVGTTGHRRDTSTAGVSGDTWRPEPGTTWQWQLSGVADTSVDAEMFDVDLFETQAALVADLHERGRVVVCYLSAGAWEEFRPTPTRFPDGLVGNSNGWRGTLLDVRRLETLRADHGGQADMCAAKGFDGVEVDNIDGYANDTGFR